MKNKLTDDFILGLVVGEGCFTFSTSNALSADGRKIKRRIPAFSIGMHVRDYELLEKVRDSMGLKNKVYRFKSSVKDGYDRGDKAILIVREFYQLKNIVIPFFNGRLDGYKKEQFESWVEKMGSDIDVPIRFRKIAWLYKAGLYDEFSKTGDLSKLRSFD